VAAQPSTFQYEDNDLSFRFPLQPNDLLGGLKWLRRLVFPNGGKWSPQPANQPTIPFRHKFIQTMNMSWVGKGLCGAPRHMESIGYKIKHLENVAKQLILLYLPNVT
jgi:hypothetical protein